MGKINIEKLRASWNEAKDTVVPPKNQGYLSIAIKIINSKRHRI